MRSRERWVGQKPFSWNKAKRERAHIRSTKHFFSLPHSVLRRRRCVAELLSRVAGGRGRGHVTRIAPWGRRTGRGGPGPAGSWCWCTWARWRVAADRGAAAGRWREGWPEQAGTRGRVPCWRRADSTCTQPGSTPPLDASQSPVRKVGNEKVKRRVKRDSDSVGSQGSLQIPPNDPLWFPHEAGETAAMLTSCHSSQWNSVTL